MEIEDVYERMRVREAMAKDLFMQYDSNGDGVLDFNEMVQMVLDLLPSYGPAEGRAIMRKEFMALDRDGSSSIDFPEFVIYYNKMISYQGGNTHSYEEGGSSTDFWSSDGTDGAQQHAKVLYKLHQRKKLNDEEYKRASYMLKARFMILDLKVALATYKRAETTIPLKRLLRQTQHDVDQQMTLSAKFWSMTAEEIDNAKSKSDQWQAMGIISFDEYLQLRDLLDRRVMMTEIKAVMDTNDTNLLKNVLQNAKDEEDVLPMSRCAAVGQGGPPEP